MPIGIHARIGDASEVSCRICGKSSPLIARWLRLCLECIRGEPERACQAAVEAHRASRRSFNLPVAPPRHEGGLPCPLCAQACRLDEGERGYCGLRTARGGRLVHLAGTARRGLLHWYRDPLPTNCVADWVCTGSNQVGRHNLAVFYGSCTLNCLFCQNWHYREMVAAGEPLLSASELAARANEETYCVCFFGGDPASQMPHALAAAAEMARRGVVVCWETAGTSHPRLLDRAVTLSLATGGCIKFDLKAYDEALHIALTGSSNRRTLENFARAAQRVRERPEPPLVVASTLLVPGYVDAEEVARIARFIALLDRQIPYALLAFAPQFHFADLPRTSVRHAREAEAAARAAGLTDVRIGNLHLLSHAY